MKKFTFLFSRSDAHDPVATIVVVHTRKVFKGTAEQTAEEQVLELLVNAVDDWSRHTPLGKRLRVESSEDTNIGDMAGYLQPLERSLRPFVMLAGFDRFEITSLTEHMLVNYDKLLIKPD